MAGEGPTPSQPRTGLVQTFSCPSCGASVTIRASGQSVVAICGGCRSTIDVSSPNYKIISQYFARKRYEPLIPLGRRGELFGETYELIGFMVRGDTGSSFTWHEYLLFNPYHGFRWLTMANGHWNFLTMTKEQPTGTLDQESAKYDGKTYQMYFGGRARVDYVFGEFYWRVKVNDCVRVADYIRPPQILSVEHDQNERIWSVGEYVEPDVIRTAFKVETPLPVKVGVAPNQPSPYAKITGWFFLFLAVIWGIQMTTLSIARRETAYQGEFVFRRTETDRIKITPPFVLTGRVSSVEVTSWAPVNNNWIELELSLIETNTGKTVLFEQGMEYYSGYDEGAWSEGKNTHRLLISSVPPGTYYLSVNPHADSTVNEMPYNIKVARNAPNWSNFWLAFGLITLPAAYSWFIRRSFEVNRWADSDYSPYLSEDSDSEDSDDSE